MTKTACRPVACYNPQHTNNWRYTMNTSRMTLKDLINEMDPAAQIAAFRSITHSAMARCIGAIRQDIRDRKRLERDPEAAQTDIDVRNDQDIESTGVPEEVRQTFGFEDSTSPLAQASLWHAVYSTADSAVRTLAQSRWDNPLSLNEMLSFMVERVQPLGQREAEVLAEAAETDVETIRKFHEMQARDEREQLLEALPEIRLTFEGFGDNGYDDPIEDLPVIDCHQLGVRTLEGLRKARESLLKRVMRSRRLDDLSSIPMFKDAEKRLAEWLSFFENDHSMEIHAALEQGRNIRTLAEVTAA